MRAAPRLPRPSRRKEAIGSNFAERFLPPEHQRTFRDGLQQYLDTGYGPMLNRRVEMVAHRREGGEFPVEMTLSAVAAATTLASLLTWQVFTEQFGKTLGPLFVIAVVVAGSGAVGRWWRVPRLFLVLVQVALVGMLVNLAGHRAGFEVAAEHRSKLGIRH